MFQDQRQKNPFMDTRNNSSLLMWENMPLEKRLRKVIGDISASSLFAAFGPAAQMGKKEIEQIATACTDGFNMAFGEDFCLKQSEKGLRFIVCHEVLHILKRDVYVLKSLFDKNPQIANKAADYTNNADLVAMDPKKQFLDWDLVDIQICLNIERWPSGTSPFVIFRDLLKDQEENKPDTGDQPLDEHDFEGAAGQSPEEKQARQKEIDRADEQGKVAEKRMKEADGEGGGKGDEGGGHIRESRFKNTIVPWADALMLELTRISNGHDSTTYGRVNRRHASNRRLILPASISEQIGRILVGCDTSASVTKDQHALHMGGSAQIFQSLRPEAVDLLYWGSSIERHEEYDEFNLADFADSTKPTGFGGTSLSKVKDWIEQSEHEYEAIIIFTDGDLFSDWKLEGWGAPIFYCVSDPKNWQREPAEGALIPVMA